MNCGGCGAPLSFDAVGMSGKLIRRNAEICFCYPCLAKKFDVSVARLKEKADEYRRSGCALFASLPPKESGQG